MQLRSRDRDSPEEESETSMRLNRATKRRKLKTIEQSDASDESGRRQSIQKQKYCLQSERNLAEEMFSDVPEDERQKILVSNAVEFFHLQ